MRLPSEFQYHHRDVCAFSRRARTQPIEPFLDSVPSQYSLVLWIPPVLQRKIARMAKVLRRDALGQFIYSPDRYHMTVLGGIPTAYCSPEDIAGAIEQLLPEYPLHLIVYGAGTSTAATAAAVYCRGDRLIELRYAISEAIGWKPDYTHYNSAWEHLGWICFLRYRSQPSPEFYDVLDTYGEHSFGKVNVLQYGLYQVTGRTFAPGTFQKIAEY